MEEIKKCIGSNTKICVAVKADGYGHGAYEVSQTALAAGAHCLAVSAVSEGRELREAGISADILVLSLPTPQEIPELLGLKLIPLVFDAEFIHMLNVKALEAGTVLDVHLKIDTGMGRIGCTPADAPILAGLLSSSEGLNLAGICTHFSSSDSLREEDINFTHMQFDRFMQAVSLIKDAGINPGMLHCANSGAVLLYPETHLDMVRCGLLAYGYYPGDLAQSLQGSSHDSRPVLEPVMELCTQVSAIMHVMPGTPISYGHTWKAPSETDIGIIPCGYGDGILRRYGKKLCVTIGGRPYPIVGRICMDQCMIDLGTDSGVKRWDRVSIFGPASAGSLFSAEDIARDNDTIPYEIICGINKRVPRIIVQSTSA